MRGCLWYGRRKRSRKDLAVANGSSPKRDSDIDDIKDAVWFDSRLVFESDSEDDFKSVNGDSLPSSFGYSHTSQGTPRPTFASLKERMEELVHENGYHQGPSPPQSVRATSEGKKTLGQLFTANKLEEDKRPETETNISATLRQGSKKGFLHDGVSQRSCFPALLSSTCSTEKELPSKSDAPKAKATQSRLPYRLCSF